MEVRKKMNKDKAKRKYLMRPVELIGTSAVISVGFLLVMMLTLRPDDWETWQKILVIFGVVFIACLVLTAMLLLARRIPRNRATKSNPSLDAVTQQVMSWLEDAKNIPVNKSAKRLAGVLRYPQGLRFTVDFVDGVIRPEDIHIAAKKLSQIAPEVPRFLPLYLRMAIRAGGFFAPILPWPIVPIARKVLRGMVSHLIIDGTETKLSKAFGHIV